MKKLVPIILILVLLLAACTTPYVEEDPPPEPPTTPEPTPEPTPQPEPYRNPLTGEPIDADPGNRRPYAVIINNIGVALPHHGLSRADIIFEILAEGDITRMVAIFSNIEDIGSIGSMRSARTYYVEVARAFDAIFVHAGGSDAAYAAISRYGIDNMDGVRGRYGDRIFFRDRDRMRHGVEHSMFTSSERLLEFTKTLGIRTEHLEEDHDYGLTFVERAEMRSGMLAASVNVRFGRGKETKFTYHPGIGYTAFQYGSVLIDGNTDEAVEFSNILVLYAQTRVIDGYGRRDITLTGSGTGYHISHGMAVPITWHRESNGSIFTYYLEDGTPLELTIGRTYIAIVPMDSEITKR